MNWIFIAIVAYLLFAASAVADKFLLTNVVRHPVAYAFYIGITGPFSLLLAPFGLHALSSADLFVAIIAGVCFTLALFFFFSAVKQTTVSRILPIEGGLVPLFTLVAAFFLLDERLALNQYVAFVFLVIGAVLISFRYERGGWHAKALQNAIIAAVLFALSFTLTKYIFDQSNFISGMVWTRLGFFVTALGFLVSKEYRIHIFQAPKQAQTRNIAIYYGSRFIGTIGGFLQNYAIALGSVTIVNALQGVQFVFLLILTTFLSFNYPKVLKEQVSGAILAQKLAAIVLITAGLIILGS
jgi:drug/metabolite transporter (DMT)-like permease